MYWYRVRSICRHGKCVRIATDNCPDDSSSELLACNNDSVEGAITAFADQVGNISISGVYLVAFDTQYGFTFTDGQNSNSTGAAVISNGDSFVSNLTCYCSLSPDQYLNATAWSEAVSATSSSFQFHDFLLPVGIAQYAVVAIYNYASFYELAASGNSHLFSDMLDFAYNKTADNITAATYTGERGSYTTGASAKEQNLTSFTSLFEWAQGLFCDGNMTPSDRSACNQWALAGESVTDNSMQLFSNTKKKYYQSLSVVLKHWLVSLKVCWRTFCVCYCVVVISQCKSKKDQNLVQIIQKYYRLSSCPFSLQNVCAHYFACVWWLIRTEAIFID